MKAKFAVIIFLAVFTMSGCAYVQKAKRTDDLEIENKNLMARIAELEKEKTKEVESVVKQKDREFLLVWPVLEDRDAPVEVFTENGPGAGAALGREGVLSEVDAATDRDRDGMP